jgi:hypothetical protein
MKDSVFFFRIFVLVLAPLRSMLLWARMAALMINMNFCVFFSHHCNRIWASECVVVDACVVVSWLWWIIYLLYCIVLFVCRMIMSEGNFEVAASRVQQGSATWWHIYFALKEHRVEWPLLMILGFWWCWWEYYWETIEDSGYGTAMKLENTRIGACNVRFPSCGGCWGGEEGENVVNDDDLWAFKTRWANDDVIIFSILVHVLGAGELHLSVSSLRVSVLWLSVWSRFSPHFGRKLALMTVWGLFVCHEFVVNLRALD